MKYKHISKPQTILLKAVQEIFPTAFIVEEYNIGKKLRLDVFLPDLGYAFEYHGEQHYKFVPHFHNNISKYYEQIERDQTKEERCEELGIQMFITSDIKDIEIQILEFLENFPVTKYRKMPREGVDKATKRAKKQYALKKYKPIKQKKDYKIWQQQTKKSQRQRNQALLQKVQLAQKQQNKQNYQEKLKKLREK